MRPRPLVASVALTAVLATVALPGPVGSRTPSRWPSPEAAAFQAVSIPAIERTDATVATIDPARRSAAALGADTVLVEPSTGDGSAGASRPSVGRPDVPQPAGPLRTAVRPPRTTISGWASFYDNGTTAMRLPRGTVVRICGGGGCIERVVNDYGPAAWIRPVRIVDMYRPDFFAICGCGWWSGTTWVTIGIY